MNTYSGHISYTVFDTAGWKDAFIAASSANCMDAASKQYPGTNVGSDPENYVTSESRRIDFILYDGFDICSYQNIFTQKQNIYPSDHLPIKVRIDFSILF
jgi:endonuclease/exonuclease/phosphatase family metal-dependent hydrolase